MRTDRGRFAPFRRVSPRPAISPADGSDRNVRRIGAIIHTTEQLDPLDRETIAETPVTSPARTLIDLAAIAPRPALTAALDGALRDGLLSEDFLHARVDALPAKAAMGIPTLLAVIGAIDIPGGAQLAQSEACASSTPHNYLDPFPNRSSVAAATG